MRIEDLLDNHKDSLHKALDEEINVLRELLASLFEEEAAVLSQDNSKCSLILENRLELMNHLEICHPDVMSLTVNFAKLRKISLPELSYISYVESLNLLKSCLKENDIELLTQCDQLEAIINNIATKSDRIGQLIKLRTTSGPSTPRTLRPRLQEKKLPKVKVAVLLADDIAP